jgi:hypothetical protein
MAQIPGLHVVYRSYGGENSKPRPPFYSKGLALASLVRATEALDAECTVSFVNDGTLPPERLALMERMGQVIPIDGGSTRLSYRAALAWAAAQPWPEHDLVWFAEDDYLYVEGALKHLTAAATRIPEADYLSLWGHLALDTSAPRTGPRARPKEMSTADPDAVDLDGVRWYRQMSTTSTFGVRVATLHQDLRLLRLVPYTGGAWDHATCLSIQGLQPFTWSQVAGLARQAVTGQPAGSDGRALATSRMAMYSVVNMRSRRRQEIRRQLYASDPQLIYHMEYPDQARGTRSWDAVARECSQWAATRGLPANDEGQDVSDVSDAPGRLPFR